MLWSVLVSFEPLGFVLPRTSFCISASSLITTRVSLGMPWIWKCQWLSLPSFCPYINQMAGNLLGISMINQNDNYSTSTDTTSLRIFWTTMNCDNLITSHSTIRKQWDCLKSLLTRAQIWIMKVLQSFLLSYDFKQYLKFCSNLGPNHMSITIGICKLIRVSGCSKRS